jgi:uncharacterized protein YdhG (YjbR/CyaY superfamily)
MTMAAARNDNGVTTALAAAPAKLRPRLRTLRALVHDTARETAGVGRLEEALKWGQPSFLTPETKSGSTIRIGATKDQRAAMFFHCQTNLVETFRRLYPKTFVYEGNRAIVFEDNRMLDEKALRHCIALALTYHQRKA